MTSTPDEPEDAASGIPDPGDEARGDESPPPFAPPGSVPPPQSLPTYQVPPGYQAPPGGPFGYPGSPDAPPPKQGPSFGAGIGIGVGIGCGAYVVGGIVMLATISLIGNIFGFIWPFILIVVAAIVMMFFARTRPIATGILIVSAAAWVVVIGPCLALTVPVAG
jgi:hypothetical protein